MNTMKFEHRTFDFHGVFICRCPPAGDSRRCLRRGVLEGVAWRQGKAEQGAEFACPILRRRRSWGFDL